MGTGMATNDTDRSGLVARMGMKVQRYRTQGEALKRELAEARAELEKANREREELRAKADSSVHLKELERLRGQMRQARHRYEFDKLASEAGANPKALDDLYAASGWKAESEEVDVESLRSTIQTLREQKDYYFAGNGGGAPPESAPRPTRPAPGSGKGAPVLGGGPVISEDLAANDPGYAMRNYAKISAYYRDKYDVVE